jgi:hypothetical protein
VLAALIIFRVFYLLVPFALAITVVLLFERARVAQAWRDRTAAQGISPVPSPLHMPTASPPPSPAIPAPAPVPTASNPPSERVDF